MLGDSFEFRNQILAIHIQGHVAFRTEHILYELRAGMDRNDFLLGYDNYMGQEAGSKYSTAV
jgi:hypothetical protein